MSAYVTSIYRYPVKSLGGTPAERVYVDEAGVVGDRVYAFLDLESGRLCNAKNPRKYGSLLGCVAYYTDEPAPGAPLPPVHVRFPGGAVGRQDEDLDSLMSRFIGRSVKLIDTVPETVTTEIVWDEASGMAKTGPYTEAVVTADGDHLTTITGARRSTRFVDLTPLHLVSLPSLRHFRALEPAANFDARRYRPSIVVDAEGSGRVEESWIGGTLEASTGLQIEVVMITPRCVMSTLEHAPDVPLDRTTLRTIVRHNTQQVPGFSRGACLGAYADVGRAGRLAVGDLLEFRPGSPEEVAGRTTRYRSATRSKSRST